MPCACHNINLIIKDGFETCPEFEALIKKICKNVVNKSKFSILIAEELRKIGKKFCKRCITRWNSNLFVARAVLKVTPQEFKTIKGNMPTRTPQQRETKKNFDITSEERAMLVELVSVLELFEWVSDELQGNQVTISRVYPCVLYLQSELTNNFEKLKYTKDLRLALLDSLNRRFLPLISSDNVYIISTFLDPRFGLDAFPVEIKEKVLKCIRKLIILPETSIIAKEKEQPKERDRSDKYNKYITITQEEDSLPSQKDSKDILIDSYLYALKLNNNAVNKTSCALEFWKQNEQNFLPLAELAKKYLSVPASSACVERMFSIAGHIFSLKRRRLGVQVFSDIVWLKLNEMFY